MQKKIPSMLIMPKDHPGQRLDNFLFYHLTHIPKSRIYRAIRSGEVRINKKRAKSSQKVLPGDLVRVPPPFRDCVEKGKKISSAMAIKIEQHVIFEDQNLLVINKPQGLAVHGGSGLSFGVIELLRAARPEQNYLELAHRIDKLTSGCLLIAKKRSILKQLHHCFTVGWVRKEYLAVVDGKWPKSLQKIDYPLSRGDDASGQRIAVVDPKNGKPCLTLCRVLKQNHHRSLLQVRPKTGRLHQIRAHCKAAGYPISNDPKYNQSVQSKCMGLHAAKLQFTLTDLDKAYTIEAETDKAFRQLMDSD